MAVPRKTTALMGGAAAIAIFGGLLAGYARGGSGNGSIDPSAQPAASSAAATPSPSQSSGSFPFLPISFDYPGRDGSYWHASITELPELEVDVDESASPPGKARVKWSIEGSVGGTLTPASPYGDARRTQVLGVEYYYGGQQTGVRSDGNPDFGLLCTYYGDTVETPSNGGTNTTTLGNGCGPIAQIGTSVQGRSNNTSDLTEIADNSTAESADVPVAQARAGARQYTDAPHGLAAIKFKSIPCTVYYIPKTNTLLAVNGVSLFDDRSCQIQNIRIGKG